MTHNVTRAALSAFSLALAMLAAPASAEVVEEKASAFVTRTSAVVAADERAAWMALISPAEWWSKSHTWTGNAANLSLTPQAGGCFCEAVPGKDAGERIGLDGSVEHMRVIYAAPDEVLRMRGALGPLQSEPVNGVLTITLAKHPKGTRITFEYVVGGYMRFETPMIARAVDGVLIEQLTGLARSLGAVELPKAATPPPAKPDEAAKPAGEGANPPAAAISPAGARQPPAAAPAPVSGTRPATAGGPAPVGATRPPATSATAPAATPPAAAPRPTNGGAQNAIGKVDLPPSSAAARAPTPTAPAAAPTVAPKPATAAKDAPKPEPKPEPKDAPKPGPKISVDAAFGDLVDD